MDTKIGFSQRNALAGLHDDHRQRTAHLREVPDLLEDDGDVSLQAEVEEALQAFDDYLAQLA